MEVETNNCWLCERIKENDYKIENSHKTLKLNIYKSHSNRYYIQAVGEDIIEQEIVYCPICGRRLEGLEKMIEENYKHIPYID